MVVFCISAMIVSTCTCTSSHLSSCRYQSSSMVIEGHVAEWIVHGTSTVV